MYPELNEMEKIINARWQSWDSNSNENLTLRETEGGIFASGTITNRGKESYIVKYSITCDDSWRTKKCEIELKENGEKLKLKSDGFGRWLNESVPVAELNGAIDVDITATPFTNTLPIRRLRLKENQSEEISVVYIAVPELSVSIQRQRYTCLVPNRVYRFEQSDTDFVREIETDENGLVEIYPGLFKRIK